MKSGELHQCWLLHARPYRESSLLLELFSRTEGRQGAIARGVRSGSKRGTSWKKSLLQPFVPLQIGLGGRGELRTVNQLEGGGLAIVLTGERLLAGLYLNELLVRLLPAHEDESLLFEEYGRAVAALAGNAELEPLLRNFELTLLEALGYALQLDFDANDGKPIEPGISYLLHEGGGFVRVLASAGLDAETQGIQGEVLLAMAQRDFSSLQTRRQAKQLLRTVLQQHLGNREIVSRSLFARHPPTSTQQR